MQREHILDILSAHKQEFSEKYGVSRLGIFGSVARNEATEASDVDIIVEMPPDLFQMVHMKEELEQLLVAPVDLIRYQKYLNALLKRRIDQEAIYV
ncbi:MAG: nucleotidyltransferase family protein [Chloroflexi bacterium]|nr:nucleotidyltransferase family protein [Chloroflexota bacterium]